VLSQSQIVRVEVPHFKEFKLRGFVSLILDPLIVKYLPPMKARKFKDRAFVFNMLNTKYPQVLDSLVRLAVKSRKNVDDELAPGLKIGGNMLEALKLYSGVPHGSRAHGIGAKATDRAKSEKAVKKKRPYSELNVEFESTSGKRWIKKDKHN